MNGVKPTEPEVKPLTKRQRGRLWARGFGFLLSIRRDENTKLTNIYRTGFGEAPIR